MAEPVACHSAPAQAARLAWARRPRRLTPLPWPSPRGLRERAPARCAWRRAHRGHGVPRAPSTASRNSTSPRGQLTPTGVPDPVLGAEVDKRRHALFMAKPSKVPSRLCLDAALKLRKTATSPGHVPEKDPRLSFFARVHHPCGRELQDRGRRCSAVLSRYVVSALRHAQRATIHAEGGSECRCLLCAAAGLVFNECSSCTGSLDVGELLVCEQTLHW